MSLNSKPSLSSSSSDRGTKDTNHNAPNTTDPDPEQEPDHSAIRFDLLHYLSAHLGLRRQLLTFLATLGDDKWVWRDHAIVGYCEAHGLGYERLAELVPRFRRMMHEPGLRAAILGREGMKMGGVRSLLFGGEVLIVPGFQVIFISFMAGSR